MQGKRSKKVELTVEDAGNHGDPLGVYYEDGTFEQVAVGLAKKRRARRANVSFVMLEESAATLAPVSLTPTQERILNYLLRIYYEDEQMSVVTQAQMGRDLALEKSNLRRALADLLSRRFLYRIGPSAWMVSPHYGFRGNTKLWRSLLEKYDAPDWNV